MSVEKPASPAPSLKSAQEAIAVLFSSGQVVELRALGSRYTASGYYDSADTLAADTIRLAGKTEFHGVYWTLQTPNTALLARSPNQFRERARETTSDLDVTSFRWMLIDLDPKRPSGISSSDEEKKAAFSIAEDVIRFFRQLGHDPVFADSGNGYHVLVRIDLPAIDSTLVSRVLEALDAKFSTDAVKLDRKVFNASRISKAYGTISRKGADMPDRPHRASSLLYVPNTPSVPLDRSILEKLAAEVKTGKTKDTKQKANNPVELLERFLDEGAVSRGPRLEYRDGWKWQLECCPFNDSHKSPDAIVSVGGNGALGFSCSHDSCSDKHWEEFRKFVEVKIGHPFAFVETNDANAIITNPGHLLEMTKKSELVLHKIGLKYFERNNELVNTAYGRDVAEVKNIERSKDSVIIIEASSETIQRDLDSGATYVSLSKDGPSIVHVPRLLPSQIHDRVRCESRDVPFPSLDMVTASPVLLPSGNVHIKIFDENVLFVPRDRNHFPKITGNPTKADALAAMKLFDEIFCKFPFVDPHKTVQQWNETASYSVVLSGVFSLVARPYLGLSAVPIHSVTASTPRSGKTKLVEAISASGIGYKPTAAHFIDEEELGKQLQPMMRAGDRAILLDNIERSLQSAKLCVLVTGGVLRDRVLGESREVSLKNYAVIFATGNNLVIGGDLTARSLRCDIDAQVERPESRAFDFEPVDRAIERHPTLAMAALTALRGYLLAGSPWQVKRPAWGGFERWDRLVSGCLTWLGYADPFETRDRVLSADPIRMANIDILEEWHKRYAERSVSLSEIRRDRGEVYDSLLKDNTWDGHHAQWVLRRMEGKIVGGLRLERLAGRATFRVVKWNDRQYEMPMTA